MSPKEKHALVQISKALLETVEESGSNGAPSGPMYAACMNLISLDIYEAIMKALVDAGRITKTGHVYYIKK